MKGLIVALQFMTRLPMPRMTVSEAEFAASMRWFPAVGLTVGLVVAGAASAGALLGPWPGALAALVAWVGVTGALHLDGLGDIADAGGATHDDRSRLLAVLADPHIGSFGTAAIVLQLVAKLVLVHALLEAGPPTALILVPFAARLGPLAWTRWLPPLHEGLAARFRGVVRRRDLALWAAAVLAAAAAWPALLAVLLFVPAWGWWLRRRIGGISGDGHGAGIELCEIALLLALVVGARLA